MGWDQPRTCGEYRLAGFEKLAGHGSAPHMRGIHKTRPHRRFVPGISPAHAGNTFDAITYLQSGLDQPRTCGEYRNSQMCAVTLRGSAPHMRGILSSIIRNGLSNWISPAHAGNTSILADHAQLGEDQPRTCGEYNRLSRAIVALGGSAPHMRGIRRGPRLHRRGRRISPAHAGNTECDGAGTHVEWISPAHAGNTHGAVGDVSGSWDQPRTCGEYARVAVLPGFRGGSAPHMRGIRPGLRVR